tara:strand:- start:3509 stop:3811 length:303 start_codon:yes stop_codon:yes gene_type:complete
MINSKEQRVEARRIAREEYLAAAAVFLTPSKHAEALKEQAVEATRRRLKQNRRYKSLVGSLLLAVLMKVVMKLIEQWIEENLFSASEVPEEYQKSEHGYE